MLGGNVSDAVSKRNLIWFWIAVVILTFHGCMVVDWMTEDETAPAIKATQPDGDFR